MDVNLKKVTITLCFRFATGTSGYEALLKMNFPLPSIRTLQRKIQALEFQGGVLTEVFDILKLKVQGMTSVERNVCLSIDEMAISPSFDYDGRTDSIIGHVTLPDGEKDQRATHVQVALLGGVSSRWKQVVGFWFTGNSTPASEAGHQLYELIKRATEIGLNVIAVTSDMGPSNQSLNK